MLAVTLFGIFIISALIGIITRGSRASSTTAQGSLARGRVRAYGHPRLVAGDLHRRHRAGRRQRRTSASAHRRSWPTATRARWRTRSGRAWRTRGTTRDRLPLAATRWTSTTSRSPASQTSRSIIILAPENDDPDADVIKTMLAVTNDPGAAPEPYHIVAEMRDAANIEVARLVGGDEAQFVLVGDLIARIVAQTCRQTGLSVVYTELLDFGGDEIYFASVPELVGQTFGDALLAFEDSSLIGLCRPTASRALNPPMETVIAAGDQLIVIAEDDDTVRLAEPPVADRRGGDPHASPDRARARRTLVLGWNWRAPGRSSASSTATWRPARRCSSSSPTSPRSTAAVGRARPDLQQPDASSSRPADTTEPRRARGARRRVARPHHRAVLRRRARDAARRRADAHHAPPPARHRRARRRRILDRAARCSTSATARSPR